MSIVPLGSGPSAPIQVLQGSTLSVGDAVAGDTDSAQDGSSPAVDVPDSATFSAQAVAMLQAQQNVPVQDGGWKLSDTQAAQLSAAIQQFDPSLFDHLDRNGDGRLNADELKTGIRQLAQQVPADAAGAGAAPTPQDQLETIRQALRSMLAGGVHGAHHHHRHQAAAGTAAAGQAPAAAQLRTTAAGQGATPSDPDGDGDTDSASRSTQGGAPGVSQRSLADLLAELDRPGR